jgi:acetolactate synthase-1/2/3 large subunit
MFMAKGAMPFSHPLSLGTIGLQSHDYVSCGFDRADVIICVGYDMIEYHPYLWHSDRDKKIIHIDAIATPTPASRSSPRRSSGTCGGLWSPRTS